jgi:hypothetical protein
MTAAAEHHSPVGKADTIDTWKARRRMPVPTAAGYILELHIVSLYETLSANGLPLDLLISAQKTRSDPVKQFGVLFSQKPPEWQKYDIPVLWLRDGGSGLGRWR